MKRIVFLVLALIANVIADKKEDLSGIATYFETDTQTIQLCLNEAGTNMSEMHIAMEKWDNKEIKDIDENTKESLRKTFTTSGHFIACILEKKDLMKDSKLVVNKILNLMFNKDHTLNKEVMTQCLTSLNEDTELTREYRAFEFLTCPMDSETNVSKQ